MFSFSLLFPFFDTLPLPSIVDILSFLHLDDLQRASAVCKRMRTACDEERLWERLCREIFPSDLFTSPHPEKGTTYKEFLLTNYLHAKLLISIPPN